MDAAAAVDLAAWEQALLDTMLPDDTGGRPVVLACDDEALRAAARRLHLPADQAAGLFISALRDTHAISRDRGLTGAVEEIRAFSRQPAPRPTPAFLGALCATVLAASQMDRDEQHTTSAYYHRLCRLLDVAPLDGWPAVAGFRELVQDGFPALAAWLSRDIAGRRGALVLPARPRPSIVGVPVSQTVLRGRDRELLSGFFAAHERHLRAGFDPVALLRRWSGRERLTQPAQQVLADPALADALATSLQAAFSAWDGAVSDGSGRRTWPGLLRLIPRRGKVVIRLSVAALDRDQSAQAPDGSDVQLRAHPHDCTLPVGLLTRAAIGPVRLDIAAGAVLAIPGPTVLFEITGGGLEQTHVASDRPVWVLTCESDVLALAEDSDRFACELPGVWALLADIDPGRLPARLRFSAAAGAAVRGAELAGGLGLGAGAWLIDHPPHVLCDLPEPAAVIVDGRDRGYLEPGEPLTLDELAGVSGEHLVLIGDIYPLAFELRDRGLREGIGSLRHHPRHPMLGHAGAIDADTDDGPQVAGAHVSGDQPEAWRAPMLVRVNATVHVIYGDGTVRPCAPPDPPAWLRQVGLAHAVDRWEIPDAHDAVWLCIDSDPHPRVLAVSTDTVSGTSEALGVADWFGDDPVIDQSGGGAAERWRELVAVARAQERRC